MWKVLYNRIKRQLRLPAEIRNKTQDDICYSLYLKQNNSNMSVLGIIYNACKKFINMIGNYFG